MTIEALQNLSEEFEEAIHHVRQMLDRPTWSIGPALPVPSAELATGSMGWRWQISGVGGGAEPGAETTGSRLGALYIVTVSGRSWPGPVRASGVFVGAPPRGVVLQRTSRSPFLVIAARVDRGSVALLREIATSARLELEKDE
ncbi:MAG TPA: hypothetical protein VGV89_04500 [Thermoplasmata archaeon]|nr:hypothetical protein [Thermoplasmata archaeon]